MKNIYLIFSLISLTLYCRAQNPTPNHGFENWTQVGNRYDPDNWSNLNSQTAILGVLTCTRSTDMHSGSYAIKLTTRSVFGITANGIATTGTLITTPPYGVTGGINYTGRPDSITGWYKYSPAGSDFGFVELNLLDANNDTVGYVRFNTPAAMVGSYTYFSAPVNYFSSASPTHCFWILSSSPGTNPTVGSAIWVDDIAMVFTGVGIDAPAVENPLSVFYERSQKQIIVNSHFKHSQIHLYDVSGKEILNSLLNESTIAINVSNLTAGIYFYRVEGDRATNGINGKVVLF